jgi:hypothetical protein
MGMIVNVPGHHTEAKTEVQPRSDKTRIIAIILNKSKVPFRLRGARIEPEKKGAIADWQILSGDTVVRQWLAAGALEVLEEREYLPTAPPPEADPALENKLPEPEPAATRRRKTTDE